MKTAFHEETLNVQMATHAIIKPHPQGCIDAARHVASLE